MSYQEDVLGLTPQMLDRLHFWVGWLCHKYNINNMYLIFLKTLCSDDSK